LKIQCSKSNTLGYSKKILYFPSQFFLLEKKINFWKLQHFYKIIEISVAAAKVLGSLLHFDIADGQAAQKMIGFYPTHKK
jgi:hypothetical protein